MRRIIYCPNDSMLSTAKEMASITKLPINIGDFEATFDLMFDRDKVQVLNIPEYNYFIFKEHVDLGFHQNIVYFNDFIKMENNIFVYINDVEYSPSYEEKNKVKFVILEQSAGTKKCIIKFDKEDIGSFDYEVS